MCVCVSNCDGCDVMRWPHYLTSSPLSLSMASPATSPALSAGPSGSTASMKTGS